MRHIYHSMMTILIIAASAFFFSSCDRDMEEAIIISGEWRGDFGMYYDYEVRGRIYTFDCTDTRITFIPDYTYATHGYGKQVDYYRDGPYEYQYYNFEWSIRGGYIYLRYDYDHNLDTRISNYVMNNDYFSGYFPETGTRFRLYKVADYYDWSPYTGNYCYGSRYGWGVSYYAPTRSEEAADSTVMEGQVVRRGRRTEIN